MFVLFTTFFIIQKIVPTTNIQIMTPSGALLGSTLTSRLGKTIYSFRGIRFAEPPTGKLRFKPPVPSKRWTGVYNATVDGPACPQPRALGLIVPISEDCLFLNVYTTKLPHSRIPNVRRPVIIFIYPGAFVQGTGTSDLAGPQYLMDQKVVLVTINYRLGALGFLAVGEEAPGNNGLKDQVVAMKWTKNNVAAFGGDPNSITIFGHSAGGCSVTGHLVSPMSRGLFHKAIFASCSLTALFPLKTNQTNLAKKQARLVGCPDDTPKNIVNCLRTKPAMKIALTIRKFEEFDDDPIFTYLPVIEEDYGQERFLTEHPIKTIVNGNFAKVPILGGMTKDEFGSRAFTVTSNENLTRILNEHWEKYAPIVFCYEKGTKKSQRISKSVRRFYLNNRPISPATTYALGRIYADTLTGFAINRGVELFAENSNSPVYYYSLSLGVLPFGAYHGEDYVYLFKVLELSPIDEIMSFPNPKTIERFTSFFASFAKTGNPTSYPNAEIKWKPYNSRTKKYLDIGETLSMKSHIFERRYNFWKKQVPISNYL